MKKIIISLSFLFFAAINPSYADAVFYTNINAPLDSSRAINLENKNQNFIPVSNLKYNNKIKHVDLLKLKKGVSSVTNILGVVEYGNAGILEAAKDGRIHKIYFVELNKEISSPFFIKRYTTTVYGE